MVALVGSLGALQSGTTSVTGAWGTGQTRVAGNLGTALVTSYGANNIVNTGGTWTKVSGSDVVQGSIHTALYWKILGSGEAAPTFTSTSATRMSCQIDEWSDGNGWPSNPLDTYGTKTEASAVTTTTATINNPGNPTVAGALILGVFQWYAGTARTYSDGGSSANVTGMAAMNNDCGTSLNQHHQAAYGTVTASGQTTSLTKTSGTRSGTWASIAAVLKPNPPVDLVVDKAVQAIVSGTPTLTEIPIDPNSLVSDTWTRTVASGWGPADRGGNYTLAVGNISLFSADGSVGKIAYTSTDAQQVMNLTSVTQLDSEAYLDITFDRIPATVIYGYVLLRGNQGTGVYLRCGLQIDATTGKIWIRVQCAPSGSVIGGTNVDPSLTLTPGTMYRIRARIEGNDQARVRVKVWALPGSEPGSWQFDRIDTTNIAPTVLGYFGVRVSGGDTTATTASVDNLAGYAAPSTYLVVDKAVQSVVSPNVDLTLPSIDLIVDKAVQAVHSNNVDVTTDNTLSMDAAIEAVVSPTVDLTQLHLLAVNNAVESVVSPEVTVTLGAIDLTVGKAVQTVKSSNVDLKYVAVSGWTFWVDASQLNLADNAAVSSWTDYAASPHPLTQGTGASQPLFKVSGPTGKPALYFDGTDDFMSVTWAQSQPITYAIVLKFDATTSRMPLDGGSLYLFDHSGNYWQVYAASTSFTASGLGYVNTDPHVIIVTFNGASSAIWQDGTKATGTVGTGGQTRIQLSRYASDGDYIQGYLMEIISWPSALSDSDAATMNSALNAKWAISTPTLAIANAVHAVHSDNVTVTQVGENLSMNNAVHAVHSDNVTLGGITTDLTMANSLHAVHSDTRFTGLPVAIAPGSTSAQIQTAINNNPEGTTFTFTPGSVYTFSGAITPKNGNQFLGSGIIDPWWGRRHRSFTGAIWDGGSSATRAVDGGSAIRDVVIDGIEIRNFLVAAQQFAIQANDGVSWPYPYFGWLIQNCYIHHNGTTSVGGGGVGIGQWSTLKNCLVTYNVQEGFSAHGNYGTIADCEISYNNPDKAISVGEQGGGKIWRTRHFTFSRNYAHHNGGTGLWSDMNNVWTLYEHNVVIENSAHGIFHEISYTAEFRYNYMAGNGRPYSQGGGDTINWISNGGGLVLSNDQGDHVGAVVEVHHNVFVDNTQGMVGFEEIRNDEPEDPDMPDPFRLRNLRFHDNVVTMPVPATAGGYWSAGADELAGTNDPDFWDIEALDYQWYNNEYRQPTSGAGKWYWAAGSKNWTQWTTYGFDSGSTNTAITTLYIDNPWPCTYGLLTNVLDSHSDNVTLTETGTVTLTMANGVHASHSDNVALTQTHVLTVAAALEAVHSDAPTLQVGVIDLTVTNAIEAVVVENAVLTQLHLLTVANAVESIVVENAAITQLHILTIANAIEVVVSDVPILVTGTTLTVAAAIEPVVSANVVLTQLHLLAVDTSLHAVHSDNVEVTSEGTLVVAAAIEAMRSENVALTQLHLLIVDKAVEATVSENAVLTQLHILTLNNAIEAVVSDNVNLSGTGFLGVDNAKHLEIVDNVVLSQLHILTVAKAIEASTSENVVLIQVLTLSMNNAVEAVHLDSVVLAQLHILAVGNSIHTETASNVSLTAVITLTTQSGIHLVYSDNISMSPWVFLVVAACIHFSLSQSVILRGRGLGQPLVWHNGSWTPQPIWKWDGADWHLTKLRRWTGNDWELV